jgi:hypothetical protein
LINSTKSLNDGGVAIFSDVNLDGQLDIFSANSDVLWFDGASFPNGDFATMPGSAVNVTSQPLYSSVADFTGDGFPDYIISVRKKVLCRMKRHF